MKNSAILFTLLLSIFLLNASISAQVSISATNTAVTENFDALLNTGTANTWTDNSTIQGGYSNRIIYRAGTGSDNAGALYSFGSTATTERALGSVASGSASPVFGIRYVNNTGAPITSLTISYTGEQWRNGGNTTAQSLIFDYRQSATVTDLTTGTYTSVPLLNFTSLVNTATAAALDGNLGANRTALSQTINVTIPIGEEIMIRWTDVNDAGNDHGFGVDDLSVTAVGAPASDIDLTIGRTVDQTIAAFNDTVIYTITVVNSGTTTANNVRATFVVPNGLSYASSTVSNGFTASETSGTVTFDGGTIAGGGSAVLTVLTTAATEGSIATSAITGVTVDPANTIVETNELNNNAADAVETRIQFPAIISGLFGRPTLAQLMADIADIGGAQTVFINSNLTENTTITVPNGLIIDFGAFVIDGTGNFFFNDGGGIRTSHQNGIGDATHPGNIQTLGATVIGTTTDFTYYFNALLAEFGSIGQTAYGMPAQVDDFTINNSQTVTIVAPFTITGDLFLTNGIINNGSNTIKLSAFSRNNGENGSGGNGTSYVNGEVEKIIPFFGKAQLGLDLCYIFPVGTVGGAQAGYSPMRMCWNSSNFGNSLKAQAFDTTSPSVTTPSLSRYWQLEENGNINVDLQFNWVEGDESDLNSMMDLRIFRSNLSICTLASNCSVDLTGNVASIDGVSDFSPWTVAQFVPTAANVEVSGKVLDTLGNAIANARVSVINQNGTVRTVRTNNFGNYKIEDLESGRTYIFTVQNRENTFASQVVTLQENVTDLNFTAIN